MGLAVPAFAGELLPERTVGRRGAAAGGAPRRHRLVLAILAPVATHELTVQKDQAVLKGTALVLDAQPAAAGQARPGARACSTACRPSARGPACGTRSPRERADFAKDPTPRRARRAARRRGRARRAGRVPRAVPDRRRARAARRRAAAPAGARARRSAPPRSSPRSPSALYAVEADRRAPPEVVAARPLPAAAAARAPAASSGALQDQALKLLDRAACKAGSTPRGAGAGAWRTRSARPAYQAQVRRRPAQRGSGVLSLLGGLSSSRHSPPSLAAANSRPASAASAARSIGASGSVASTTSVSSAGQRSQRLAGADERHRAAQPAGVDDVEHGSIMPWATSSVLVFLLLAVAVLAGLGLRSGVPYPVALVLGGLVIGLVPGPAVAAARPRRRVLRLPAAAALLGRGHHVVAGAAGRVAADRAARRRARAADDRRRGRRGERRDRASRGRRRSRSAPCSARPTRCPPPPCSTGSA